MLSAISYQLSAISYQYFGVRAFGPLREMMRVCVYPHKAARSAAHPCF
jgi:hypothetical protein